MNSEKKKFSFLKKLLALLTEMAALKMQTSQLAGLKVNII